MKRTALKRKTPLTRKPMRRRKGRTKYARRERDIPRMLWCKSQDCSLREVENVTCSEWLGPGPDSCNGAIEAHHAGDHAGFQKPPDDTCIPVCSKHHYDAEHYDGPFAGWPRGAVHAWELAMIPIYQARYAEHLSGSQDATL